MKLATYKDGSRDGQLVVVSRDLSQAHYATGIAHTLAQVLDDWNFLSPQLQDVFVMLNQGKARHAFAFDPRMCMAPLPRARQWLHAPLADEPLAPGPPEAPRLCAGDPSHLRSANAALGLHDPQSLIDVEAQWGVLCGDVAAGSTAEEAQECVRLLVLVADMVLRQQEPVGAWPSVASRPATVLAPVAITPDEVGDAWQGGRLLLPLQLSVNGRKLGLCSGADMPVSAGQLLAQASATRSLQTGSLVGLGSWLSPATEPRQWPKGGLSVALRRAIEAETDGEPSTPWLLPNDEVRIDVKGRDGNSVFGPTAIRVGSPEAS